jgi:predicted nucleic acid-binding protein
MRVAVTDANIFIDVIHIELQDELFAAELEIHTTLSVLDELNERQQAILATHIKQKQLTVHSKEPTNIPREVEANKRLSPSDKSVFSLAIELHALILTGDGLLRKVSVSQKIEVHGIIWLLDRFIEKNLIAKNKATEQLRRLMLYNKRLPVEDCEKRFKDWS